MDCKIVSKGYGLITTDEREKSIRNNLILSLEIPRGGWWLDPDFGSRLHELHQAKVTNETTRLAEHYALEATRWIIDCGRASSIDAKADIVSRLEGKSLQLHVSAIQADGRETGYETWVDVI